MKRLPPISWYPGGKWTMAMKILPHLPPHTCYVEPYCGVASVFFAKDRPTSSYMEVLNDIDDQLITFLRVVRDRRDEIERLLSETPFAHKEYLRALAILRGDEFADDLWTAWAFFVAQQQSYSGTRSAFAAEPPQKDGQKNMVATTASKVKSLPLFQRRLLDASLECRSALACLRVYDAPGTLFYCDPPYAGSGQCYKHSNFGEADLVELCAFLSSCEGSFVLSHPPHDAIPAAWPFVEFSLAGAIGTPRGGRRALRTERLYVVDRSHLCPPALAQKLWRPLPLAKEVTP